MEEVAVRTDGRPSVIRYAQAFPLEGMRGDMEAMALWAGESAGLVDQIQPAGEIVKELAEEAVAVLRSGVNHITG